jgi:hypothetical protein
VAIARIGDEHSTQFEVGRVLASAGRDLVPFAARQAQAAAALAWLATLAERPSELFLVDRITPAVERPLYVPSLQKAAALVLSDLPTASAQQALVEMASEGALPLETRRIGAVAFGRSVRQYGVRLTTAEIRRQYDRYNSSRLLGRDTQGILSSILDAIEGGAEADPPPAVDGAPAGKPAADAQPEGAGAGR